MLVMASPGPKIEENRAEGGYECEFVTPSPDYLQTECSVCLLVLRLPQITSCCGMNFCEECIKRMREERKPCPLCNARNFSLTYNRAYDGALKQLEVYCTHRKLTCQWKGKLEMLDNHLNVDPEPEKKLEGCAFVKVRCCHDGCGQSLQRRLIAKHQTEECPQRPLTCEYCRSYKATYHDVTTNHWPVCKSYPLPCPNKCTQNTIQRHNLKHHLNKDCPLQTVECEFKHAGCATKLLRKDMPEHLKENLVGHVTLLARQNQELRTENQKLTRKNQDLTEKVQKLHCHVQVVPIYPIAPVQIVFTNFDQHKRDKDQWCSEGFYTHPQGYKICLLVYANGNGSGEDTHMSCYIYLMHGDFDNRLKWPFRGVVTIQLLNQREHNNHCTVTVTFNDEIPANYKARVISGERAPNGWGHRQFIPHSELGHNIATNSQYLMNDCIYFQVKFKLL